MKLALCFFGQPRLIDRCSNDIINYFFPAATCDIYAHFWWDESHAGKVNRLHIHEAYPVDYKPIEIFTSIYSPKKIIFEDLPKYDISGCKLEGWNEACLEESKKQYDLSMGSFCAYTFYTRHLSAKKAIDLIEDPEQYDLVVLLRTDLLKFSNTTLMNDIQACNFQNTIYCPSSLEGGPKFAGEHPNRIFDMFFIGTYSNIVSFFYTALNILIDKKIRIPIHNQERLLFFAGHAGVSITKFNTSISVRRFFYEEWENIHYYRSHKIDPTIYEHQIELVTRTFHLHPLLPFYASNIINVMIPTM